MPDFAKQETLALDSLGIDFRMMLCSEDWKMRPYHDGSIDAPGHLNQGLNLISAMKTIRFWKAISSINDVVVSFSEIRQNILEIRNPPFQEDEGHDRQQAHDGQFHRWYRTMPLVWEALSLQPIGHQVELGGVRGMFRMARL